jgi:hypothetical protein
MNRDSRNSWQCGDKGRRQNLVSNQIWREKLTTVQNGLPVWTAEQAFSPRSARPMRGAFSP